MPSSDYTTVAEAARTLEVEPSTVYRYLRKPAAETGIRRMKVGRNTFVHLQSLIDYEATVTLGRPRKN